MLVAQLSEAFLTLGNMLPPGPQREKVYERGCEIGGINL